MHLLPAERSGHRVIDGERVCEAIAALGPATDVRALADGPVGALLAR